MLTVPEIKYKRGADVLSDFSEKVISTGTDAAATEYTELTTFDAMRY